VVTQTIKNKALVVPTSAVTDQDGHSYVNVLDSDGASIRTVFTKGKVGADNSGVLAGLTEGQKVLLPPPGRYHSPDHQHPTHRLLGRTRPHPPRPHPPIGRAIKPRFTG
jgi:hypothetical protein